MTKPTDTKIHIGVICFSGTLFIFIIEKFGFSFFSGAAIVFLLIACLRTLMSLHKLGELKKAEFRGINGNPTPVITEANKRIAEGCVALVAALFFIVLAWAFTGTQPADAGVQSKQPNHAIKADEKTAGDSR